MASSVYRVMYIGGAGIELAFPLSDGRKDFAGHVVIELENYQDYVRLMDNRLFVEVKPKSVQTETVKPVVPETTKPLVKTTATAVKMEKENVS